MKLKKRWGDRSDGYRVESSDPLFAVMPHFMNNRCDSQVLFDNEIDIGALEKTIRQLRRTTDMTELSMLHVIIAACVRMTAVYPCINRFVCGRRLYARNKIVIAFNIKKSLSLEAPESILKVEFEPTDTLSEVYRKVSDVIRVNKAEETENGTGAFNRIMSALPMGLVAAAVGLIKGLDFWGVLPRFIQDISPFHSTMYLTDVGSLGIGSVYHHLYNFGTCSMFCALGKKGRTLKKNDDGDIVYTKTMDIRFTVDERIADGCYFAFAFRDFVKVLRKPETLLSPPETVALDPGLRSRAALPEPAVTV